MTFILNFFLKDSILKIPDPLFMFDDSWRNVSKHHEARKKVVARRWVCVFVKVSDIHVSSYIKNKMNHFKSLFCIPIRKILGSDQNHIR